METMSKKINDIKHEDDGKDIPLTTTIRRFFVGIIFLFFFTMTVLNTIYGLITLNTIHLLSGGFYGLLMWGFVFVHDSFFPNDKLNKKEE